MSLKSNEIDYEIVGSEMQLVEIELDPQESVIAEAGSMMYMESGIQMETIFGDGSEKVIPEVLWASFLLPARDSLQVKVSL